MKRRHNFDISSHFNETNSNSTKSYDVYIKHPFTMEICGPTGCGKTQWLKKLIENSKTVSFEPPVKITYFYTEWQEAFDVLNNYGNIVFENILPNNILEKFNGQQPEWIIFDDMMNQISKNQQICELFTRGSHHRNLSVIILTQNFFSKGEVKRTISLQLQYIVLFKNPRDKTVINFIARQLHPSNPKYVIESFNDATKKPYSYLFIDLKPKTDDIVRLLTNVFEEESEGIIAYVPA